MLVNGTLAGLMVGGMALALLAARRGESEAVTFWTRVSLISFGGFLLYALPKLAQSLFLAGSSGLPFHVPLLGVVFGLLIVVVTGAAFMTGNNLFYLLLAVLSATLIVSMLANRLNLNRLDVELRAPQHVFAQEAASLTVTLSNLKRFSPVFSLTLMLEAAHGQDPASAQTEEEAPHLLACFAIVPARGRATQQVAHIFARRGVYSLDRMYLLTRFPFGLVERRQRVPQKGEIVVYPPLLPLGEFATAPQLQVGQYESMQRGQGGELYLIRPYQSADRRRAIDWKATAKTAQLMTRELTREEDWQVTIIFDADTPVENEDVFEKAINFAASLIDWLIAKGAAVRLQVMQPAKTEETALSGRYGAGRPHGLTLLAALARISAPPALPGKIGGAPDWMNRLSHVLQRHQMPQEHTPAEVAPAWLQALAEVRDGRTSLLLLTPLERASLPAWLTDKAQVFCFTEL